MTRGEVWSRLGAPHEQVGSANEPRSTSEQGFCFNEKWVYLDGAGRPERVVLWDRYDLVAILRVDGNGSWQPEA